jgi:hypothetical protein
MNDRDHAEGPADHWYPVESDAAHLVAKDVERWIPIFFPFTDRTVERSKEAGTQIKKLLVRHSMRPRSPLAIRT